MMARDLRDFWDEFLLAINPALNRFRRHPLPEDELRLRIFGGFTGEMIRIGWKPYQWSRIWLDRNPGLSMEDFLFYLRAFKQRTDLFPKYGVPLEFDFSLAESDCNPASERIFFSSPVRQLPESGKPMVFDENSVNPDREGLMPMREWYPNFREWPTILVYGGQGSGKTTFAMRLLHDRAQAGHRIQVLDPHAAYGQWEPFKVVGAGMEYSEIDRAMRQFAAEVKAFYKARATQPDVVAEKVTACCEEMTKWASHCEESGSFFEASLADLRKANRGVVYIAHDRTLTALGGGKGVSAVCGGRLVELELEAKIDQKTGKPVPAMRGKLYMPGRKREPIPVALDYWEPPANQQSSKTANAAIAAPRDVRQLTLTVPIAAKQSLGEIPFANEGSEDKDWQDWLKIRDVYEQYAQGKVGHRQMQMALSESGSAGGGLISKVDRLIRKFANQEEMGGAA